MENKKYKFLNRIKEELNEIKTFPLEGIELSSIDYSFTDYIINIRLLDGIFEGYCIQLLMKFSYDYPRIIPTIYIFPGQKLESYHKLIYISNEELDNENFYTFYLDINCVISFRILLLQIQFFLSNPQIEDEYLPTPKEINNLMKSMDYYRMNFMINNELITHTWKNPYPNKKSINETIDRIKYFIKESHFYLQMKIEKINHNENKYNVQNDKYSLIKNNLTCFASKMNYLDNPNLIFGYPINKNLDGQLVPYPEIMSLKAYEKEKLDNSNDFWLPIYINDDYFNKNKDKLLMYFSKIKYGEKKQKKYNLDLEDAFEVLINILTTMIIYISQNFLSINPSFLRCFFHFILFYKKLFWYYKKSFKKYSNNYLDNYIKEIKNRKNKLNNNSGIFEIIKILLLLLFDNDPNSQKKAKFKKILEISKKRYILEEFNNNPQFLIKNNQLFIDDLYKHEIFDKIVDIIISDKNINQGKKSKNFRKKIIGNISDNFKELYNICDTERKNKINELLYNNINLCNEDYFDLDINHILNENKTIEINLQESFNILQIFHILSKKINEPNFFDDLMKNYGVLISTHYLINEINKINEEKNILKFIENIYEKDIIVIVYLEKYNKPNNIDNIINLQEKENINIIKDNNISIKKYYNLQIQKQNNFEIIKNSHNNNNYSYNNDYNSNYINYSDTDIEESENTNDELYSKYSFDENDDKYNDEELFKIDIKTRQKKKKIIKKKKMKRIFFMFK